MRATPRGTIMKQETKLGLIAVGIVVGMFSIVGAGVVVLTASAKPSAKLGITSPTGLAAHRWWSPGMTDAKLESIVQAAIATPSTDYVIAYPDGTFIVRPQEWTPTQPAIKLRFPADRRPKRDEVVAEIAKQLDRAEYRDH